MSNLHSGPLSARESLQLSRWMLSPWEASVSLEAAWHAWRWGAGSQTIHIHRQLAQSSRPRCQGSSVGVPVRCGARLQPVSPASLQGTTLRSRPSTPRLRAECPRQRPVAFTVCWPMDCSGEANRDGWRRTLQRSNAQWGHSGLVRVKRYSDNGGFLCPGGHSRGLNRTHETNTTTGAKNGARPTIPKAACGGHCRKIRKAASKTWKQ